MFLIPSLSLYINSTYFKNYFSESIHTVSTCSGNGKISTSIFDKAIKGHVKPKSKIIQDGDHAHYKMIKDYELDEFYYKANVKNKEYLEVMNLINSFSSWIKKIFI